MWEVRWTPAPDGPYECATTYNRQLALDYRAELARGGQAPDGHVASAPLCYPEDVRHKGLHIRHTPLRTNLLKPEQWQANGDDNALRARHAPPVVPTLTRTLDRILGLATAHCSTYDVHGASGRCYKRVETSLGLRLDTSVRTGRRRCDDVRRMRKHV
eukprot:scaffold262227_cov31-Tisochrysis_lutea.AAC.1